LLEYIIAICQLNDYTIIARLKLTVKEI